MALPIRVVNFLCFPRSILTLYRHHVVKFQHCVPTQSCKVSNCTTEDCADFLPWLENKAGMQISSSLSIGKSDYGRVLNGLLISLVFPSLESCIARYTMHKCLRVVINGVLHYKLIVVFWSEEELRMIQQSFVYLETINQEAQIREEYLTIKPVFDQFPERFENVGFESFKHAYGLVASRAWGSMKGQSLIPFADFLNHHGTSESIASDEKDQLSEIIADRDYVPGEEVLICYGKFPNSSLLLDFGFTVPYNIYDQVCIQIDIPYDDHLRELKLGLLQKHCFSKIKDAGFSTRGFSFVIKEVRSLRGKGKGIPQSLRAFARVMCCTSSQELHDLAMEAVQNDGRLARRPLIKRSLEIQAHKFLLSLIDELIEKCCLSIQSLNVPEAPKCKKFAVRRQMAHDLLTGEVRILISASTWLKSYCQSYPGQGKTTISSLQYSNKDE